MMNADEVLAVYERVSELNEQMLAAAQRSDWDNLLMLEANCHDQVEVLKKNVPIEGLSGEVRARKIELIHRILACDREIRSITETWTKQLAALLGNTSSQRKLNAAYGMSR